ncbi:hypothetical protein CEXT_52331 [Caerostris extrusa]|uniref:Uncharacterized protein n=1 Tax=Caerostris extrusa TaxID=172846 RepID=A0AAV4RNJ5_CAEEX|nr:hypothetical protein CEXT_52331 [Caerostris extrusa]
MFIRNEFVKVLIDDYDAFENQKQNQFCKRRPSLFTQTLREKPQETPPPPSNDLILPKRCHKKGPAH